MPALAPPVCSRPPALGQPGAAAGRAGGVAHGVAAQRQRRRQRARRRLKGPPAPRARIHPAPARPPPPAAAMEGPRLRWAVKSAELSAAQLEYLLHRVCPEEERAEVARFRQPDDRKRAVVSRLLQHAAAAAALAVGPGDVRLRRTREGKPYAATNGGARPQAPNWNFNVSHEVRGGRRRCGTGSRALLPRSARRCCGRRPSPTAAARCCHPAPAARQGQYVVLAAEPVCVCGVDVTAPQRAWRSRAQPLPDFFRSYQEQFTAAEWAAIRGAGRKAAQEALFMCGRRLRAVAGARVGGRAQGCHRAGAAGCRVPTAPATALSPQEAVGAQGGVCQGHGAGAGL